MKKILSILLILLTICSCANNSNPLSLNLEVEEDTKFDGVYAKITIEDFINKGFEYGDSIDVIFSNGLEFKDIPFYSGYYVKRGLPLVVGYKGYPYIEITRSSNGLWTESGLKDGDNVTLTLNTKSKYKTIEDTFSLIHSDDPNDYEDKYMFANYREMTGGNLKEKLLYRGASPLDNKRNRAKVVNELIEQDSIKYIIDLADSKEEYPNFIEEGNLQGSYIESLYNINNILFLGMSADYSSDSYKESVASACRYIIQNEGPFYIHCQEGKDRTGFVCLIIEAISDYSDEELFNDYTKTFENYFGITSSDKEQIEAIREIYFNSFIEYLDTYKPQASIKENAINYLLSAGLTQEEISNLVNKITQK